MSRLDDLKTTLARATLTRNRRVAELQEQIRATNRAYDEVATRLQREITKLEPVLEAPPMEAPAPKRARKPRESKPKGPDVWAAIEQFNRERANGRV